MMMGRSAIYLSLLIVGVSFDYLQAKDPPRVMSVYSKRHFVHPGDSVRLLCPVESVPPPLITWQRDGQAIHVGWDRYRVQEDGRVLRIKDVERTDAGPFVCQATNGFGSVDVKHFLYIYGANETSVTYSEDDVIDEKDSDSFLPYNQRKEGGKPKEELELIPPFPDNVTVPSGGLAIFTCHVQGESTTRIQWLKLVDVGEKTNKHVDNSSVTVWNQRYAVLDSDVTIALRDGSYLSKLAIQEVSERDSGMYVCYTTNGRGFGFRSAYLNVVPGPSVSRDLSSSFGAADASMADSAYLPVVIATVSVVGIVFVAVVLLVVCRRYHLSRSKPVSLTPPTSGHAPPQRRPPVIDPSSVQVTETAVPSSSSSPLSLSPPWQCQESQQQYPGSLHPGGRFDPRLQHTAPLLAQNYQIPQAQKLFTDRTVKYPDNGYRQCAGGYTGGTYAVPADTSSECSTLFKPTPAPAGTPIPDRDLEHAFQHLLADPTFFHQHPQMHYYEEC